MNVKNSSVLLCFILSSTFVVAQSSEPDGIVKAQSYTLQYPSSYGHVKKYNSLQILQWSPPEQENLVCQMVVDIARFDCVVSQPTSASSVWATMPASDDIEKGSREKISKVHLTIEPDDVLEELNKTKIRIDELMDKVQKLTIELKMNIK